LVTDFVDEREEPVSLAVSSDGCPGDVYGSRVTWQNSRAGESAYLKAARQRSAAARLTESAERWERGAAGEAAVAAALAELETDGWTVRHDVAWPGRPLANLDHVVIGGGAAYVIDAKNWTGRVSMSDGTLRQNGRDRSKEVQAVATAANAVAGLAPDADGQAVRPVLCLVRDERLSERLDGVMVCSTQNLTALLRTQPAPSRPLSDAQERRLLDRLTAATAARRAVPLSVRPVTRRRGKRKTPSIAGLAAAVAMSATLILQPAWFSAGIERVSDLLVSHLVPDGTQPPPENPQPHHRAPRPHDAEKHPSRT
jgi:hypothetical protein